MLSSFQNDSERIVAFVGEGLTLQDACAKTQIPYETVRSWITKGRRDPAGTYGAWERRLGDAKAGAAGDRTEPTDAAAADGTGPVEAKLDDLLSGHELAGAQALAAEQARTLARRVDQLGQTPGAAAGQAMAYVSRRLEEIISLLEVPREDEVDRLRRQRSQRRGERPIDAWTPNGERDVPTNPTEASNGKPSREVEIERERPW